MKRYFCTVATGIVLALVGTGTATAGLPLPGGSGTQLVTFGDQTVGEQKNDADVTQAQGNGNLNIAPAVAIFGDAGTWNAQGNGNEATANDRPVELGRAVAVVDAEAVARAGRRQVLQAVRAKRQCSPKGHSESPTWKKEKDDCCAGTEPGRHAGGDLRRPDGRRAEERRRCHAEAGQRQRQRVARRVLRRRSTSPATPSARTRGGRMATTPRPSRVRATGTRRAPGSTSRTRSPRRRKRASSSRSPSGARGWSPASDDASAGRARCPAGASSSERRGDDQRVDQPASHHTSDHRPRARGARSSSQRAIRPPRSPAFSGSRRTPSERTSSACWCAWRPERVRMQWRSRIATGCYCWTAKGGPSRTSSSGVSRLVHPRASKAP